MREAKAAKRPVIRGALFVVLVPRNDGSLRFGVNYCRLSAITKRSTYTVPQINDYIDSLGNEKMISSLNASPDYRHIERDDKDINKLPFLKYQRLPGYTEMPSELKCAPKTFQ